MLRGFYGESWRENLLCEKCLLILYMLCSFVKVVVIIQNKIGPIMHCVLEKMSTRETNKNFFSLFNGCLMML